MASPFTIELQGLNATLDRLKKAGQDVSAEVDAEIQAGALDIERDAALKVAVDTGILKGFISSKRLGPLAAEVVAQKKYAPYVEFGTITKVSIPQGAEAYAAQFKGKGIRKTGGMRPRPFMFPALRKNTPRILERIKKVITKTR